MNFYHNIGAQLCNHYHHHNLDWTGPAFTTTLGCTWPPCSASSAFSSSASSSMKWGGFLQWKLLQRLNFSHQNIKESYHFRINGNIRTFQDLIDHFVETKQGTVDTSVSTNVMIWFEHRLLVTCYLVTLSFGEGVRGGVKVLKATFWLLVITAQMMLQLTPV